jgi:hypothetical protein
MKKINLILVSLLILAINLVAQPTDTTRDKIVVSPTPTEGTIMYDKTQVPCYNIEIPFSEVVAEEAIKKRFKQMGAGTKERKGFMEFKNVSIAEIKNGSLVDAYIRVDRKSKKEKESSIVSLIITDPGVLPGGANDQEKNNSGASATGAYSLLSSLNENSADHALELDIKKQEDVVRKSDKQYNNLVKDGEDLQSKLKRTQNDIEANKADQVKQAEELKKQKEILLQIQARRKTAPGEKKN